MSHHVRSAFVNPITYESLSELGFVPSPSSPLHLEPHLPPRAGSSPRLPLRCLLPQVHRALATLLVFLLLKHNVQSLTSRPLGVLVSSQNPFLAGLQMADSFLPFSHQYPGSSSKRPPLTTAGGGSPGPSLLHYLRVFPSEPSALPEMISVLDCIIQRWPQRYLLLTHSSRTLPLSNGQSCDF